MIQVCIADCSDKTDAAIVDLLNQYVWGQALLSRKKAI